MKPRANQKLIEKYYDFQNDKAICKLCSKILKIERTFNLKKHLINVHKIKKDDFSIDSGSIVDCSSNSTGSSSGSKSLTTTKTTENIFKRSIKIEINKEKFLTSYIGLITEDSLPFSMLDSVNLKNIIEPICRGLSLKYEKTFNLDSNSCANILKVLSKKIRDDLKSELKHRILSLKIDRILKNIFVIRAQFIKANDIETRTLDIIEVKGVGANATENLNTELLTILTKYEINLDQIISINSDIFEAHNTTTDANGIYLSNVQLFVESLEIQFGDIQIQRYASDIAQLCAFDVLIENIDIQNFIFNARNLVKFIRKPSNGYLELFELNNLPVPQLDAATIPGSTYNMLVAIKDAENILAEITALENKSIDENFILNNYFWNFINAYCIAFEPLQHALTKFQQEPLHLGNFYAEWLKCKICTEKIFEECNATIHVEKMAKKLFKSMEKITVKLLKNDQIISCLYLDPRFQHTLTPMQKTAAANYLKKLYERINKFMTALDECKIEEEFSSSTIDANTESCDFVEKADEYLNEYLTRNFNTPFGTDEHVNTKIEQLQLHFQRVDTNVLHFWRDRRCSDPELYNLSNICFAMPANQIIDNPFDVLQHGKRTLSINLKAPEGQNLVRKLATKCDVFIEPYRPGVLEKLNLGPELLCADNPRLIYARLTGFGQHGRLAQRAGHDLNYIAISGVLSMLGRKHDKPNAPINLLADFAGGGLMCAFGICIALLERYRSGCGQVVDAAMIDGAAYVASWLYMSRGLDIWGAKRGESMLDGGAYFYDTYETKDGRYMSVAAIEPQFFELVKLRLQLPEDLTQYDAEDQERGRRLLEKAFREKTQDEWSQIFEDIDACVYPVIEWQKVMQHDHNATRESFQKDEKQDLIVPKPAPRLSRTPGEVRRSNNDAAAAEARKILKHEVGLTDDELQKFIKSGVVLLPREQAKL